MARHRSAKPPTPVRIRKRPQRINPLQLSITGDFYFDIVSNPEIILCSNYYTFTSRKEFQFMKKLLLLLFVVLCCNISSAQPNIKFDTLNFDLGMIAEKTRIVKEFVFTNTGNEPLIISDAASSDGFAGVSHQKDTIAKGKTGVIRFEYFAKRTGKIDKIIFINSNSVNHPQVLLTLKGEVVFYRTEIKADSLVRNIGALNFDEADTIQFKICNTGNSNLHISFPYYNYPESDLLWLRIKSVKSANIIDNVPEGYEPGDTLQLLLSLKNVYGNTGKFERNLFVLYNSHDTLTLKVRGYYTGKPSKPQFIDGYSYWRCIVFNYKNDRIASLIEYDYMGRLYSERFYENSNCTGKKIYDTSKGKLLEEYSYKDGVLQEKKVYK